MKTHKGLCIRIIISGILAAACTTSSAPEEPAAFVMTSGSVSSSVADGKIESASSSKSGNSPASVNSTANSFSLFDMIDPFIGEDLVSAVMEPEELKKYDPVIWGFPEIEIKDGITFKLTSANFYPWCSESGRDGLYETNDGFRINHIMDPIMIL